MLEEDNDESLHKDSGANGLICNISLNKKRKFWNAVCNKIHVVQGLTVTPQI